MSPQEGNPRSRLTRRERSFYTGTMPNEVDLKGFEPAPIARSGDASAQLLVPSGVRAAQRYQEALQPPPPPVAEVPQPREEATSGLPEAQEALRQAQEDRFAAEEARRQAEQAREEARRIAEATERRMAEMEERMALMAQRTETAGQVTEQTRNQVLVDALRDVMGPVAQTMRELNGTVTGLQHSVRGLNDQVIANAEVVRGVIDELDARFEGGAAGGVDRGPIVVNGEVMAPAVPADVEIPELGHEGMEAVLEAQGTPAREIQDLMAFVREEVDTQPMSSEERTEYEKLRLLSAQRIGYYVDNIARSVHPPEGDARRPTLRVRPETEAILQEYQNALDEGLPVEQLLPLIERLGDEANISKFFENALRSPRRGRGLPACDEDFLDVLATSAVLTPDPYKRGGSKELYRLGRTAEIDAGHLSNFFSDSLRYLYDNNPFGELNFTRELGFQPLDARQEVPYGAFPRQPGFYATRQWVVSGDETRENAEFAAQEIFAGRNDKLYTQIAVNFWSKMLPAEINHSRRIAIAIANEPAEIARVFDNKLTQSETPRWLHFLRWPASETDQMEAFTRGESGGDIGVGFRRGWFAAYHNAQFGYKDGLTYKDGHRVRYVEEMIDAWGNKTTDPNRAVRRKEVNMFLKAFGDYDPIEKDTKQTGPGVDTFYLSLVGRMLSTSDSTKREFNDVLVKKIGEGLQLSPEEQERLTREWGRIEGSGGDISLFTTSSIGELFKVIPTLKRLTRLNRNRNPLPDDTQRAIVDTALLEYFDMLVSREDAKNAAKLNKAIAEGKRPEEYPKPETYVQDAMACYKYGFNKGRVNPYDVEGILSRRRGPDRPGLETEEERKEFAKEIFAANIGRAIGQERDTYNISKIGRDEKVKRAFVKAEVDAIEAAQRKQMHPSDKVVLENLIYDNIWWSSPAEVSEYEAVNRGKNRYAKVFRSRVADKRGLIAMPTAHSGIKSIYPGYEYNVTFIDANTGETKCLIDLIQGAEGARFDPFSRVPAMRCKDVIETDFATVTNSAGKELDILVKTHDLHFDQIYEPNTFSINHEKAGEFFSQLYGAARSILSTYTDSSVFGRKQVRTEFGKIREGGGHGKGHHGGGDRVDTLEFKLGTVEDRLINEEIQFLNNEIKKVDPKLRGNYPLAVACYQILKWVEAHTTLAEKVGYRPWDDPDLSRQNLKKGLMGLEADLDEVVTPYGTEVSVPAGHLIPQNIVNLIVDPETFGAEYQKWKRAQNRV